MPNIDIPRAAEWSDDEFEKNKEILEANGQLEELAQAKSIRANAKPPEAPSKHERMERREQSKTDD